MQTEFKKERACETTTSDLPHPCRYSSSHSTACRSRWLVGSSSSSTSGSMKSARAWMSKAATSATSAGPHGRTASLPLGPERLGGGCRVHRAATSLEGRPQEAGAVSCGHQRDGPFDMLGARARRAYAIRPRRTRSAASASRRRSRGRRGSHRHVRVPTCKGVRGGAKRCKRVVRVWGEGRPRGQLWAPTWRRYPRAARRSQATSSAAPARRACRPRPCRRHWPSPRPRPPPARAAAPPPRRAARSARRRWRAPSRARSPRRPPPPARCAGSAGWAARRRSAPPRGT